jgi:DNA-binding NtrC family response regulator
LDAYLKACKSYFIRQALEHFAGNKTKASHMLGMRFRPFKYWIDEAGGPDALPKNAPLPKKFPLKQFSETIP